MDNRFQLYANTVSKMKLSQIVARVRKKLGLKNSLGVRFSYKLNQLASFESVAELDFDPVFLSRFDEDEFLNGRVTFLYESKKMNWNGKWEASDKTPLWNFNLHYFEFLMPLLHAYKINKAQRYLDGIETCIKGWIDNNPISGGGNGWTSYTISLRLVYWFSCLFELSDVLSRGLKERMINSIYEQYVYLANHLEKDILANHYFENLKALILCASAFQDQRMLEASLMEFKKQCKEQILPDGMHFELSPMYHKIILEALLRVAVALRSIGKPDIEVESYIQPMIDVAYSLEEGMDRVPLFNDGGNNVAKSLDMLVRTAKKHFGILPQYKDQLRESGYYILKNKGWKLIVDAGIPGPKYNAGHAHCDAMSFELFHQGHPILVNCGTYAYQCDERAFFRSTSAHNTVMIDNTEQSQCWSIFRTGRESYVSVLEVYPSRIVMKMTDQNKNEVIRKIQFENDVLTIEDLSKKHELSTFLHMADNNKLIPEQIRITGDNLQKKQEKCRYAYDYGKLQQCETLILTAQDYITVKIDLLNSSLFAEISN